MRQLERPTDDNQEIPIATEHLFAADLWLDLHVLKDFCAPTGQGRPWSTTSRSRDIDRFLEAGAPGSAPGRGLPIGNLTSQHFANFYLGPLDRLVTRGCQPVGYCRYMDDILVFHQSKQGLWQTPPRRRAPLGAPAL